MSTPKTPKAQNWKGSLSRLFSCGSGKKGETTDENQNAPLTRSPNNYDAVDGEVSYDVITTKATPGHGAEDEVEISYTEVKAIGKGTFGVVYRAKLCDSGELVAIKKVFHDERYKNRELQMMRKLNHPNVLELKYFFYSRGERYKSNEVYLNMMLDYMPETLYSVSQCDGTRTKPLLDIAFVRVYLYQVFRSLAYLHALGICHRDVKPQNLLLNPDTHVIKLCDFGSAKELLPGESNIAYICSRYYRAPELVLGTTNYTTQIDVWSAGCVLGELLMGQPIFPGANGPDQLVEIIKVLGTPSVEDLYEINPNYTDMRFPQLMPHPWQKVFREANDMDVLDLASHLLVYAPSKRIHPIEAVAHQFFEPLRRGYSRLPDGKSLPPTLFNFTREELSIQPELQSRLEPAVGMDAAMDSHYEVPDASYNTSKLESSSKSQRVLGQIGGSFRSSFRGIKKVATSSGKKKKKKKSGIEDDTDIQAGPATLNFSGAEDGDQGEEGMERAEITGEEITGAEIHLRPEVEDLEVSATSHESGHRQDSIPHDYRHHLSQPDNVENMTEEFAEVDVRDSGKKKKKKSSRPKAPAPPPEDIERAIEAQMVHLEESDMVHDNSSHLDGTPSSAKKKKKKKPSASTPNQDKSFEESPDFAPHMTYEDERGRSFEEELHVVDDPGNGSQVKKKKKPKVPRKAVTEGEGEGSYSVNDGAREHRRRRKVDTDL